tara:strand:+ start:179 stop:319 length:141 start_codon:yes stop_codon:yes gene_type:complete
MNFVVEKIEGEYYVNDDGDFYGPFNSYKEATNFMEEQLSILKEYGE